MNKILDYIIKKMYSDNISDEIKIINEMLNDGQITVDSLIGNDDRLTLKEFLLDKYKKTQNDEILILFKNHGINIELDENDVYKTLLHVVKKIMFERDTKKANDLWSSFLDKKYPSEKIVKHINHLKNDDIIENILSSKFNDIFMFKSVIEDYLGFENVREMIESHFTANTNYLSFTNSTSTIELINNFPYLMNIKNDKGNKLIECLFLEVPDKCIEKLVSISDEEKEYWIEFYFNEKIRNNKLHIYCENGSSNEKILISKKDWFKTQYRNEDIISVLIKSEVNKEIILKQLPKSVELKQYLISREKNMLVEYLSESKENALLKEYKYMARKIPELLERENEYGVLDSLITGDNNVFDNTAKFFELLELLPLSMKITSSPDKLLDWANKAPFFKMNSKDKKKELHNKLFLLTLSSIDKKYKDLEDQKVKESRNKFCMQERIKSLINNSYYKHPSEKEIIDIIESKSFNLSAHQLKNFELINELIKEERIDKNYLNLRLIDEEKELLKKSLNCNELILDVNKKRI